MLVKIKKKPVVYITFVAREKRRKKQKRRRKQQKRKQEEGKRKEEKWGIAKNGYLGSHLASQNAQHSTNMSQDKKLRGNIVKNCSPDPPRP